MSRRAVPPVIEPSAIVSIRASCYCGASSVSLPVRASHAEERAAIAAAVEACAKCARGRPVTTVTDAPDGADWLVATVTLCPTCGRPL